MAATLTVISLSIPSFASSKQAAGEEAARNARAPRISVDSEDYHGGRVLKNGVTFVSLREFAEALNCRVAWDYGNSTAAIYGRNFTVWATKGKREIYVNGEKIPCAGENFIIGGRLYVSLRALGTAMGYVTYWDTVSFSASLKKENKNSYSATDLYWLSRIISAEARGESMAGKIAVGTVVLNRVASPLYPSDIYSVIFDRKGGIQFTPVANGSIYNEPTAESIEAARRCLEGERIGANALFFINTKIADSFWITETRTFVMSIGNHAFYA